MHPEDRPKAVLRALVAFGKARDRWPDGIELHAFRRDRHRIGSYAEVKRQLATLREHGLVELLGRKQASRWRPTAAGFDVIAAPPIQPLWERQQCQVDVTLLLLNPKQGSHIRQRAAIVTRPGVIAIPADLEIAN